MSPSSPATPCACAAFPLLGPYLPVRPLVGALMDLPPGMVLLPCRMHARVTRQACVAMFESGQQHECGGCQLGAERGAKGPWKANPQPRMRMDLGTSPGFRERQSEAMRKRWELYRERKRAEEMARP